MELRKFPDEVIDHLRSITDEVLAEMVETDPDMQREQWETAQRLLMENFCSIPIYENLQIWARHNYLDLGYELTGSLTLGPAITETTQFVTN